MLETLVSEEDVRKTTRNAEAEPEFMTYMYGPTPGNMSGAVILRSALAC